MLMALWMTAGIAVAQQNPALVKNPVTTTTMEKATADANGVTAAEAIAAKLHDGPQHMVTGVAVTQLRNEIDAKRAKAGQVVTLTLRQNLTLTDGTVLPKGTYIEGHVEEAVKHSKETPNGSASVVFEMAKGKGVQMPVMVMVRALAPSTEAQGQVRGMNAGVIGGTANAGGDGGMGHAVIGQNTTQSGLPGVTLSAAKGVSGVMTMSGDNLYLEPGTLFTIVLAKAQTHEK